MYKLATKPLEASRGTLNVCFFGSSLCDFSILFVISLGRMVVPSLKIFINLPGTYEKLP